MEAVDLMAPRIIKAVSQFLICLAQFPVIIASQPEDKAPVRFVMGEEFRKMRDARRNQETVTVFQQIAFICHMVFHIAFQKKVELVVIMHMGGHGFKRGVIIIEQLKVNGLHVLPCVEIRGYLFFQRESPFRPDKAVT